MKRLLTHTLLIAAMAILAVSCRTDNTRAHILKVYNWADYIDEDVIPEFEEWYKEQTGEEVKVIYQLFDINEVMLAKIERGHEDYDVVCPSDYIIERMLRADLLLPIDKNFGNTPNYIDSGISPFIRGIFDKIEGSGKNANDYAVGYMWGTTGILYNKRYVTDSEASTWNILHDPRYKGKILIKDAFRDVYGPVLMTIKQDSLVNGLVSRDDLMFNTSQASIDTVEHWLRQAKELIAGWEADFGKEIMTKEKAWINMTWSGDATWAIEEAKAVGVELDYTVPKEGSNTWFDGWVIPKYAKNVKAARYFIDFMCRPDIAIRNMEATGYVSSIATKEVLEAGRDDSYEGFTDVSYFFGPGNDSVHINSVQYPAAEVVARCDMMHDSGDRTEAMLEMWARVKGDKVDVWVFVAFGATLIALGWVGIRRRMHKRSRNRRRTRCHHRR